MNSKADRPQKVIAQITFDEEKLREIVKEAVERFKEEYEIVDRPQGEWIKHDEDRDYCSVCKHIFKTRTLTKQDKWTNYIDDLGYNFCPNCGARMKGADDERSDNESAVIFR